MSNEIQMLMQMAAQYRRSSAFAQAQSILKRVIQAAPDQVEAHIELGRVYRAMREPGLAEQSLKTALEQSPDNGDAHIYLGHLYRDQLRHDESNEEYRKAIACKPATNAMYDNFLWSLQYSSHDDPTGKFELYKKYLGNPIQKSAPRLFEEYSRDGQRIKLGYIGSTLRTHSVTFFLLPVISRHSDDFEIYSYYTHDKEDETTEIIKAHSYRYRHLHGKSTEEAADQIHKDGINILIGLDADINLLKILSHKPAPIQISWIGHADTTGMDRIDYRIVDRYTDPAGGIADSIHTEKLIRMQNSFSVYKPPAGSPAVNDAPALKYGHVTFGSFNYLRKMNADVIRIWSRILNAVPGSRLFLKFVTTEKPVLRDNILSAFASHGIPPEQLHFLTGVARTADHLKHYNFIDIALDPFPYCGTTTTCDSLWMGVPVITLAGEKHIARVGLSQLTNAGLPELIADSEDEYVEIAVRLAGNIGELNTLRGELRDKISRSPLMNAENLVAELEEKLFSLREHHSKSPE